MDLSLYCFFSFREYQDFPASSIELAQSRLINRVLVTLVLKLQKQHKNYIYLME